MFKLVILWFTKKEVVSTAKEIKGNRLQGYHDSGGGYYQ